MRPALDASLGISGGYGLSPMSARDSSTAAANAAAFASTQWSVILAARSDAAGRRAALEQLCRSYWLPLYGYLRRRGHAPADAEDLTQSFFVYLIEGDFLDRPDPAKGRFRGYLVGALRHFLGTHFERAGAQKRGGGAQLVDWTGLDAEREFTAVDQPQSDPAAAYEPKPVKLSAWRAGIAPGDDYCRNFRGENQRAFENTARYFAD